MNVLVALALRFLRMHPFTRGLAVFVTGLIAWANTIPYYQDPEIVYAGYGWPYKFLELPTIVFQFPDGRTVPDKTHVFYTPEFVVNMLIAFALVGVLVVFLERVVWRHAIGRQAPASVAKQTAAAAPALATDADASGASTPPAASAPPAAAVLPAVSAKHAEA